jgi:hypothetical protein
VTQTFAVPQTPPSEECRIIWPGQLVGAATACAILGIDRSTLSRRISRGVLVPLAQLDGDGGAYVFDRSDLEPRKK